MTRPAYTVRRAESRNGDIQGSSQPNLCKNGGSEVCDTGLPSAA
jgi:hypothetical protein